MSRTLQETMAGLIARLAHVDVVMSFAGPDSFELLLSQPSGLRLKTDPPPPPPKPFGKLLVARPVDRFGGHRASAIAICHLVGPGDTVVAQFRTDLDKPLVSDDMVAAITRLCGKGIGR